jgi:hypothetical protein
MVMAEGLTALKKQAAQTLGSLQKEIARREKELSALQNEAAVCQQLLHGRVSKSSAKGSLGGSGKRIDWRSVLADLPKQFTAKDVIDKVNKPAAGIYTQLYQMTKANRLRRTKDGYEKV